MLPIRVLIVDDSAVIRKVIGEGFAGDSAIEIVGTAANGSIALQKIPQVAPDVITLDIEMPGMNGVETLIEIRKQHPKLPVIMFSTLTERGAAITLDALAQGASDYVMKPSNTGSLEVTLKQIRESLIPKVKGLCQRKAPTAHPVDKEKKFSAVEVAGKTSRVDVLAIGTSTGGPNALSDLIPHIPEDFPVPIVIVQHMPPVFTRLLAGRLNDKSKLKVKEGVPGQTIYPGEVWIAPGDFHMKVERANSGVRLAMNQDAPENSCRPAVDPLFRSVAEVYGPNVLAVVLTGMGSDGVNGSRHIRESGGQVYVQDEASSVVWGMPGQVAAAGLADSVFPLTAMPQEIVRRVGFKRNSAPVVVANH